jgi:hypothetical protein
LAYAAPAAFAVGEVVTAAKMQVLADDITYFKLSPVFDGSPVVGAAASAQTLSVFGNADAAASGPLIAKNTSAGTIGTAMTLDATGATGGRKYSFISTASGASAAGLFGIYDGTASAYRMAVDLNGNVGFGTTAPQGALHAIGKTTAFAAQGGFLTLEAAAVTTLQTIAPAGTVTKVAAFLIADFAVGSATAGGGGTGVATLTSGGFTYGSNGDTITVNVTGTGSITVQRTAGTTSSHNISLFVVYV